QRAISTDDDAGFADLLLRHRSVWLPDDRSGELQRGGGALFVRQSSSGSFLDLRVSGGQSGRLWGGLCERPATGPATALDQSGCGERRRDQNPSQRQQACRREL